MSEGPQPKRTKLFRACETCVTSKSRCSDLTSEGCALCRKKKRKCSLIKTHEGSSLSLEEECKAMKARLQVVEARAWDLEVRMRRMENGTTTDLGLRDKAVMDLEPNHDFSMEMYEPIGGPLNVDGSVTDLLATTTEPNEGFELPTSFDIPAGGTEDMAPPRQSHEDRLGNEEDYDIAVLKDLGISHTKPWDERMFSLSSSRGFPDPIQKGLTTQEQADTRFQLWRIKIKPHLPLAPFLHDSSPTPSHPFVLLSILSHVESINTKDVHNMINESISHVLTGAVDVDVMLALLLLAVNPCSHLIPSPVRLISLAYEIGVALGLEGMTKAGLEKRDMIVNPWWRTRYDEMLLWETVKNQYNFIHLSSARIGTLLPSLIHRFPVPLVDDYHYQYAIDHLTESVDRVEVFRSFLETISTIESTSIFGTPDYSFVTSCWGGLQDRLKAHRQKYQIRPTDMRSTHNEFNMAYRAIKLYQTLPSPLHQDIKIHQHNTIGSELLRISQSIVEHFTDLNMEENPPFGPEAYRAIVGAIGTILAVYAAVYKQHPNFMGLNIERTKKAEEKIHRKGGISSLILRRMREEFAAGLDQSKNYASESLLGAEDNNGTIDLSGMMDGQEVDLSAWAWLFASLNDDNGESSGSAGVGTGRGP